VHPRRSARAFFLSLYRAAVRIFRRGTKRLGIHSFSCLSGRRAIDEDRTIDRPAMREGKDIRDALCFLFVSILLPSSVHRANLYTTCIMFPCVSFSFFFRFFSFFFVFFLFFFFPPVLIPFRIRVMPFHRVIVEIVHAYCRIARECRPIDQLLNRLSHTTSTDSPPRFIISGRGGERRGGRILLRLHCYYYY